MTYNNLADETAVDTSPFRFSLWYYVHRLKGLLHDDYNYRDVNTYMSKGLKTFVKKARDPLRVS
jgi:sestrin